MKNTTWILAVVILAALFILGFRYEIVVNSPIVAKIDHVTGDVWIANSGVWLKVQHSAQDKAATPKPASSIPKPAKNAEKV